MKKNSLTALAIMGIMISAQAQQLEDNPTQYVNPFSGIGAFNYIQKQSDGELNKWFLSGKNGKDKYFTTVKSYDKKTYQYSGYRNACIINKTEGKPDDLQFCLVLDLNEMLNSGNDINRINITYSMNITVNYRVSVKGFKTNDNLVKGHTSNISTSSSNEQEEDILFKKAYVSSDDSKRISIDIEDYSYRFICIQFDLGHTTGSYEIRNILITPINKNKNIPFNEFSRKYFNESLTLIHFDTNGGDSMNDMICLYEDRDPMSSSNTEKYFHILSMSGVELGCCYYKNAIEWNDGCEPIPTREGYVFKGWLLNGQDFSFSTVNESIEKSKRQLTTSPFMGDMTLVAQWEQIGEGGGTEPNPGVVTAINDEIAQTYYSNGVLRTAGAYDISVYNTSGVLVKAAHNVSELDLSELKSGLYIARVNGEPIKFVK